MKAKAERQPVRRYYLLAVIFMLAGLVKFPWGGAAAGDITLLAVPVVLIAIAVGCAVCGRRNSQEAQA